MPSNVTVHFSVHGDARYDRLGELLGTDRFAALGRMISLWSLMTDLGTDTPPVGRIRACLGPKGPEALVEAELGEAVDGGLIRVRGAKDEKGKSRIGWRDERKEAGRRGGKAAQAKLKQKRARVEQATSSAQANHEQTTSNAEATSEQASSKHQPSGTQGSNPKIQSQGSEKPAAGAADFTECLQFFDSEFKRVSNGKAPTWDEVTCGMLKTLLSKRGREDLLSTMRVFFQPRTFPSGFAFKTLVANYDSFTGSQPSLGIGRSEPRKPHEYPDGEVKL